MIDTLEEIVAAGHLAETEAEGRGGALAPHHVGGNRSRKGRRIKEGTADIARHRLINIVGVCSRVDACCAVRSLSLFAVFLLLLYVYPCDGHCYARKRRLVVVYAL